MIVGEEFSIEKALIFGEGTTWTTNKIERDNWYNSKNNKNDKLQAEINKYRDQKFCNKPTNKTNLEWRTMLED